VDSSGVVVGVGKFDGNAQLLPLLWVDELPFRAGE
jgi:hypothetical protein